MILSNQLKKQSLVAVAGLRNKKISYKIRALRNRTILVAQVVGDGNYENTLWPCKCALKPTFRGRGHLEE